MTVRRLGNGSMMVVAVVLAFGVTLALTWPRGAPEQRTQPAAALPPAAAQRSAQMPTAAAPPLARPIAAAAAVAAREPLANEPAAAPAAELAPSVPVHLIFQSRRLNAPPDANHPGRQTVVRLVNSSREALPLEVLVTSSAQAVKLELQIVLQPHQSQELGGDDGAALEPGDVITVKSPNFRDLVRPI